MCRHGRKKIFTLGFMAFLGIVSLVSVIQIGGLSAAATFITLLIIPSDLRDSVMALKC